MTTHHPANGTSRPNLKASATKRIAKLTLLDVYKLKAEERSKRALGLQFVVDELASIGKELASTGNKDFCRACGRPFNHQAEYGPAGARMVRRYCAETRGGCGNAWRTPVAKETSR